ncbi:MSP domain-containing protein [Caerostris darwini]|uniref:MSP domain-containing protein n=1 Tax=Caerostris darwini TaxID=1538125 RepID=A0AAV4MV78_9ARAC|nr:MSP domain-containing protein [Caerostris darwini]
MAKQGGRHKRPESGKGISFSVNPCCFNLAESGEEGSSFDISNKNSYPLYFKLLTTNAFSMCFQPRKGRVEPHSKGVGAMGIILNARFVDRSNVFVVTITGYHVQSTKPIGLQQKVAIMTSHLPLDEWPDDQYYQPISQEEIQDSCAKSRSNKKEHKTDAQFESCNCYRERSKKQQNEKTSSCCFQNPDRCLTRHSSKKSKNSEEESPCVQQKCYECGLNDHGNKRELDNGFQEEQDTQQFRRHDKNNSKMIKEENLNLSIICHCEDCSSFNKTLMSSSESFPIIAEKEFGSGRRKGKRYKESPEITRDYRERKRMQESSSEDSVTNAGQNMDTNKMSRINSEGIHIFNEDKEKLSPHKYVIDDSGEVYHDSSSSSSLATSEAVSDKSYGSQVLKGILSRCNLILNKCNDISHLMHANFLLVLSLAILLAGGATYYLIVSQEKSSHCDCHPWLSHHFSSG